jgi:curved DNA-binding protein CbpA
MFTDYYALLEVESTASTSVIRSAYRRMSFRWHPDHNPGTDTNEIMQQINQARLILLNPVERSKYDRRYFHEYYALKEFQKEYDDRKYRVGSFKESNSFMYHQYTNAILRKSDFELIDAIRSSNEYQSQFIDMVIVELHENRNYNLNKIKAMLSASSIESVVTSSKNTIGWHI